MTNTRPGYAFPLALASIAIIALVVTLASEQVRQSSNALIEMETRLAVEVQARTAEHTFLYHMLTSPMASTGISIGGISAFEQEYAAARDPGSTILIPANGTALASEQVILRYFDEQSFLNMTTRSPEIMEQNLTLLGVPRQRQPSLFAAMSDYQDEDNIRLPGGAESFEYDQPRMPRNRPILNPLEVCDVAGWGEMEICQDTGRLLLLGEVRTNDQLNVALVGLPVLELLTDDLDSARSALTEIAASPYSGFSRLGYPALDVVDDPASVPGFPTDHFVLVSQDRDASIVWRTAYLLTPQSVSAPFAILSKYRIGGDYVRNTLKVGVDESVQPLPEAGGEPRTP